MNRLPVESVLESLGAALAAQPCVVLEAPPGAGKTTRVPLALLDAPWLAGKRILMLEPRRLAARAAALRMADTLGERVGGIVGYRVRMDTRVGPRTRIEVVTDGVLTRLLQADPALSRVGMVIFDEFHERSVEADLGLALCLDVQGVLNGSLRLLVMSATLDVGPVSDILGAAPVVACEGRTYPVETRYLDIAAETGFADAVAGSVLKAAAEETGSLLVFLPGAPEIRRVHQRILSAGLGPEWQVAPLYGHLSPAEQQAAILPAAPGRRKIVLATSIAETSLTIEGVRVVIDSGRSRRACFDVRSGMARLVTRRVSRASADQRRGRAGRTAPGVCYRLWTEAAHATFPEQDRPAILEADMTPLTLELAVWGVTDPEALSWIDPPPLAAFERARSLLFRLEALDSEGRVTGHGRKMADLPLHPRLAHMVLRAGDAGAERLACDVAALLSERDILRFPAGERDADIRLRLDVLEQMRKGKRPVDGPWMADRSAARRVIRAADHLQKRLGISGRASDTNDAGPLLALAYPDRIAKRRANGGGRFLMTGGGGAVVDASAPLAAENYIVAAELDGDRRNARVFLAAPIAEEVLVALFGRAMDRRETVVWDPRREAVRSERTLVLGAVTLRTQPLPDPDSDRTASALFEGIRLAGVSCLPWTRALLQWQGRVRLLGRAFPAAGWPDVSDEGLLACLEDWLAPHVTGVSSLKALSRIDLKTALANRLSWQFQRRLDTLAPTHITVPSGSRIPVDYTGDTPVLAVRLQEMFGAAETPQIAEGRLPLLIHLLSPAGRPVQVTGDLAGFWRHTYPEVKKELKGRYPRHYWPEDPLSAEPTARAKPKER